MLFTQVDSPLHKNIKIPCFRCLHTLSNLPAVFSVQIFKDDLRLGLLTLLDFSMDAGQAGFLYMPLMHSEDPEHHIKVAGALHTNAFISYDHTVEEGRAASKSPH